MHFSVIICAFVLTLINLKTVTGSGWRESLNRRWTSIQSNEDHEFIAIGKRTRFPPPLHKSRFRARPHGHSASSGSIQRRTSGSNKDIVHFYLYPNPM
jgi:hypothetical protein